MENNKPKILLGIDPDIDKHGVAIYKNGELIALHKWDAVNIVAYLEEIAGEYASCKASIEDVNANNFIYARNANSNRNIEKDIARRIGKVQQAQVELMKWFDNYGITYALHKPQKGNWADKRDLFERITGWAKQSNEDTRSAAFMGYLEARK